MADLENLDDGFMLDSTIRVSGEGAGEIGNDTDPDVAAGPRTTSKEWPPPPPPPAPAERRAGIYRAVTEPPIQ